MPTEVIIIVRHLARTYLLRGLALLLFLLPGHAAVTAQVEQDTVLETRTLYASEWDVPYPAGLAYATTAGHLFLLDKRNTEPTVTTSTLMLITPYEELVSKVELEFTLDDAINIAYDDSTDRLFLLNGARNELAQVAVDEDGDVDPATLVHFDVAALGLRDVQGMAVDSAKRRLLLLDSGALQVVRIALDTGSAFDSATVDRIDLSPLQVTGLRGIAVHPLTHHLYVVSRPAQRLYELADSGQPHASYTLAGLGLLDSGGLVFAPSADLTDPPDTIHLFIADSGQASMPLTATNSTASEQIYLPLVVQSPENSLSGSEAGDANQSAPALYGKIVETTLSCAGCIAVATDTPAAAAQLYLPLIQGSTANKGEDSLHASAVDLSFAPVADARVLQSNAGSNYGTLSRLDVDSPGEQSYLRFSVSGVTGAVQSATLRLFVSNGSSNGPSLYSTDNSWTETAITWNNRPTATNGVLADVGAIVANAWAEYNVTAHVTGNGVYSFLLLPDGSDGVTFHAREGANPPQLVLTFDTGPTSTPSNTATPTNTPTATTTLAATNTLTPGPSPTATATSTVTPTPTNTSASTLLTLGAVADARVLQSSAGSNYGTLSRLDVDSPGEQSYLRFSVSGVTGAVQSATLRLFVSNGSSNGPSLYSTDNSWTETGLTWNNRPAATSGVLADVGAIVAGTWAEYNVTAHVTGNGVYSFILLPDNTDGVRFDAREGTNPPELVLTFNTGPTPTPTNTATPTSTSTNTLIPLPTNTATNTPVPLTSTATATSTPTSTPTHTSLPTDTPTNTSTPIATNTPTMTPTPSGTSLPTVTPTLTPTATNTPGLSGLTLGAVADARVLQSSAGSNYGTLSRLDVDSPGEQSYLRFSVSGVTGAVQSATLRLFVSNGSSNGPSLYSTDNSWTETGITWNNRPAATSGVLADVGAIMAGAWAEYNVTAHVTGNGVYNFLLLPDNTDGVRFDAREGTNPPELVLTFNTGPTPTPTNTATPTNTPTPTNTLTPGPSPTPTNTPAVGSAVFVGAGDIADCSRTSDEATALLLDNIPGTVFTVGDNAYPNGSSTAFTNCYAPTWGRHKDRTHPAVGDNEYSTPGAAAYFSYFGAAAGNPGEGYYSFDLGGWHIIILNSNCSQIGGCEPDSAQGQWLQADLTANPSSCILAIHHEPLFSSKGGDSDLQELWAPLYAAGADVVLSGHRHNYERFAQQSPDGVAEPGRGIRQFVVGTGGSSLSSFDAGIAPNSEVRNDTAHGVIKFTLHPTSYDWEFIPIAGQSFTDAGSTPCVIP